MATKIRLARHGAKKAPFYRVVVADSRARRDGRFLEMVGRYNPRTNPSTVELNIERIDYWLETGAQPTEAVVRLIAIARGEKVAPEVKGKLSKKAVARAKAEAEAVVKAAEEAAAAAKAAEEAAAKAAEEAAAAEAEAAAAPAEEVASEEPAAEEAPAEDAAADAE